MNTSIQVVFEFFFGGILLYWSIRSQLVWLSELLEKYFRRQTKKVFYARMILRLILGLIGAHLLLDPVIPGLPTILAHAPTKYPSAIENLRVRIAPIKFNGDIDPERMSHIRFSSDLVATKVIEFRMFEEKLHLRLYDVTQPMIPLSTKVVYLSPYVRRGIWDKHVHF